MSNALERAFDSVGGPTELARQLTQRGRRTTHQAVCQWPLKGIPADRVLDIEAVTGVSRHELRPDIYPREKGRARG